MRDYQGVEGMAVEEKLKSKLYKIELVLIKALPFVLAMLYLLTTILDYYQINSTIVNYIAFGLLYLFLYVSSYAFRFCEYHRIPIHYIVLVNIISIYDVYVGIPISTYRLMQLYVIITYVFIFLTVYMYVKDNKRVTSKNN